MPSVSYFYLKPRFDGAGPAKQTDEQKQAKETETKGEKATGDVEASRRANARERRGASKKTRKCIGCTV